jgi:hypothetical protein
MKYPCKDIIKLIVKLNADEEITSSEMDILLITLEFFPEYKKYLNQTGGKKIKGHENSFY